MGPSNERQQASNKSRHEGRKFVNAQLLIFPVLASLLTPSDALVCRWWELSAAAQPTSRHPSSRLTVMLMLKLMLMLMPGRMVALGKRQTTEERHQAREYGTQHVHVDQNLGEASIEAEAEQILLYLFVCWSAHAPSCTDGCVVLPFCACRLPVGKSKRKRIRRTDGKLPGQPDGLPAQMESAAVPSSHDAAKVARQQALAELQSKRQAHQLLEVSHQAPTSKQPAKKQKQGEQQTEQPAPKHAGGQEQPAPKQTQGKERPAKQQPTAKQQKEQQAGSGANLQPVNPICLATGQVGHAQS